MGMLSMCVPETVPDFELSLNPLWASILRLTRLLSFEHQSSLNTCVQRLGRRCCVNFTLWPGKPGVRVAFANGWSPAVPGCAPRHCETMLLSKAVACVELRGHFTDVNVCTRNVEGSLAHGMLQKQRPKTLKARSHMSHEIWWQREASCAGKS